jgi:hypothetical protein
LYKKYLRRVEAKASKEQQQLYKIGLSVNEGIARRFLGGA